MVHTRRNHTQQQQQQQVEGDTDMEDTQALIPTQPTTEIHEINTVVSIDTPPTTQAIQPLQELPQLDFIQAVQSIPSSFHIDNLEVVLQQNNIFNPREDLQEIQNMLGAADDRYKDLIMFVNTQFEQGNEAFNHLRDNFKHTCTQLNQNTNHIAKSHTEIHQALMVIADKFTAMANEVKVNRGQVIAAKCFQTQAEQGLNKFESAIGDIDTRLRTMGRAVDTMQDRIGQWETDTHVRMQKSHAELHQKIQALEAKVTMADKNTQNISSTHTEATHPSLDSDSTQRIQALEDQLQKIIARMEDQETATGNLTDLLDDANERCILSGRKPEDILPPAQLRTVQEKIAALETQTIPDIQKDIDTKMKQLAGASHQHSQADTVKKITSMGATIEAHRKRIKNIEEVDGTAPIIKQIRALQNYPTHRLPVHSSQPIMQPATQTTLPPHRQPDPRPLQKSTAQPANLQNGNIVVQIHDSDDESEDEEAILQRQIDCIAAKEAAKKLLQATNTPTPQPTSVTQPNPSTAVTQQPQQVAQPTRTTNVATKQPTQTPSTQQTTHNTQAQQQPGWNIVQNKRPAYNANVDKSHWIYISNIQLGPGKRGWQDNNGNWRTTLQQILGSNATVLQGCNRAQAPPDDSRLILNTPNLAIRRTLLQQLRDARSSVKASVQLSPMVKANRALAYHSLPRSQAYIKDLGDMLCVSPAGKPQADITRLQMSKPTEELEADISNMLQTFKNKFHTGRSPSYQNNQQQYRQRVHVDGWNIHQHNTWKQARSQPTQWPTWHRRSQQAPHYHQQPIQHPHQQYTQRAPMPQNPNTSPPSNLSHGEIMQLKNLLYSLQKQPHITQMPTPSLPPPPQQNVNVPATAQLAQVMGVHPQMHGQQYMGMI